LGAPDDLKKFKNNRGRVWEGSIFNRPIIDSEAPEFNNARRMGRKRSWLTAYPSQAINFIYF
jgi:hypothetical protein